MNAALFRHILRSQRAKLAIVSVAIAAWSVFLPIIYGSFGQQIKQIVDSGIIPQQLLNFGGGDPFTLGGSIALGYIHPIAIILIGIFAVGFTTSAVAGERQRGTLEVVLARPVSRRVLYVTLLVALLLFLAIILVAAIVGTVIGCSIAGVLDELPIERLPILWLNGLLLWGAIGAIGLAASVSFDRLTPALGVTMAILIVSYFLEILGSLWPDAAGLQQYSLFHYLSAREILAGTTDVAGLALLAVVGAIAIGWAVVVFPRRDLAAPS
ncbi:MAG TPA: ABC transporter permease subunit [Candidatus Limnocylindrales bacterium]